MDSDGDARTEEKDEWYNSCAIWNDVLEIGSRGSETKWKLDITWMTTKWTVHVVGDGLPEGAFLFPTAIWSCPSTWTCLWCCFSLFTAGSVGCRSGSYSMFLGCGGRYFGMSQCTLLRTPTWYEMLLSTHSIWKAKMVSNRLRKRRWHNRQVLAKSNALAFLKNWPHASAYCVFMFVSRNSHHGTNPRLQNQNPRRAFDRQQVMVKFPLHKIRQEVTTRLRFFVFRAEKTK